MIYITIRSTKKSSIVIVTSVIVAPTASAVSKKFDNFSRAGGIVLKFQKIDNRILFLARTVARSHALADISHYDVNGYGEPRSTPGQRREREAQEEAEKK